MTEVGASTTFNSPKTRWLSDSIRGVATGLVAVAIMSLVEVSSPREADGASGFLWTLVGLGVSGFLIAMFAPYLARWAVVSIVAGVTILCVVIASPPSPFGIFALTEAVSWVKGDLGALTLLAGLLVGLPAAHRVSDRVRGWHSSKEGA